MDLSPYINSGFSILANASVIIGGNTLSCIFDTSTHNANKSLGGFAPDNEATVSIKTSDLTNPKSLKGSTLILNGSAWRIESVRYGVTVTTLMLVAEDKA